MEVDRIRYNVFVPEEQGQQEVDVIVVDEVTDEDLVWLEKQKQEKADILNWLADH